MSEKATEYFVNKGINELENELALTVATSENDVAIQKKTYGSGTTALIISNEGI